MDRVVALKLMSKELSKNKQFVDRFIREARASAKLDHPNVVRGYAVGEAEGLYYFAMEFVEGESVQDTIDREGKLDVAEAARITADVARALVSAQSQNMVHRDIKPDNILVSKEGLVKLADLGLAKQMDDDSGLTQTGSGFGTPFYMPPEQAMDAKHVDGRSDIYALGATLYHMLTGVVPFDGDTPMTVLTKKQSGTFKAARSHNDNVPPKLDLIIDKMMAVKPETRYQNCEELLLDLEGTGLVVAASSSDVSAAPGVAPGAGSAAPARRSATKAPADAAEPKGRPKPSKDSWYVRFKDATGRPAKSVMDTAQVRKLIREGKIGLGNKASRDPKTDFRPLESIAEFQDLMQSRVMQAKAERKMGGSMATKYAEMEKQHRRFKMMKKVKGLIKTAVILGVLAIGAYIAYSVITSNAEQPPAATSTPAPAARR
jgi:eukaryotic-like serine/threonine-protein kinase